MTILLSRFILDGTADYVDDGREIFDEDLNEKPAFAGKCFLHVLDLYIVCAF